MKESVLGSESELRVSARVDEARCRICENGAKPNLYHPGGKPDRLGAICVRSCLARLEEAGLNTLFMPLPLYETACFMEDYG